MTNFAKIAEYVEMCTRNMHLRHENPVGDNIIFVFDIDDCLYHSQEINEYESNHVKKGFLDLSKLTEEEWYAHNSTFNLYREVFFSILNMHPSEFCRAFDMPEIHKFVSPDSELQELIKQIPFRKFCFTNGSKERAKMVLSHLELENLFEVVICSDTIETEFICKPMSKAFEFFMNYVGVVNPKKVYFFDDSSRNIESASQIGWNTILVKSNLKECIKETVKNVENI